MPPSLADQDLRDYFWVTRDRVTAILSGVSTLPLHLRRLLTDLLETEDAVILRETRSQIGKLLPDETGTLLQELAKQLQRNPGQPHLINTWFELASVIPVAYNVLIDTLEQLPASSLDASISMKLVSMMQLHPDVCGKTERLLRQWEREPNTRVGRAAKEALKDFREGHT